jgi:hypothetical protein
MAMLLRLRKAGGRQYFESPTREESSLAAISKFWAIVLR